jgi:hypothetical protein
MLYRLTHTVPLRHLPLLLLAAACAGCGSSSDGPAPLPATPQLREPATAPLPEGDEEQLFARVSNPYAGEFQGVVRKNQQAHGYFFVDGQLAYPAMTCINPDCPAQGKGDNGLPFLFIREFKEVRQGADGEIIWPENPEVTAVPVCPACKQNDTIRPYELPSTARRMQDLAQELQSAREAYWAAKKSGQGRAAGFRTPAEIMREMEQLKQLYLVPGPPR